MSDISSDEETQVFERDFFYLSPTKRLKGTTDRLSALPDGILIHILSFLGVEESAVTSILSKRWRFIWTELPRLEFNEYTEKTEKKRQSSEFGDKTEKTREFVDKVHRTLLMRSSMTRLEKFEVNFRYSDIFACDVDHWVDFALKNKAEKVILVLNSREYLYALPGTMCSNSSLTRFLVRGCILDTRAKFEWKSLIRLDFNNSKLSQHVIENILSGCPALHTLGLGGCWGFTSVVAKSKNLHELKVHFCAGEKESSLEISIPYVQTLDISFSPEKTKLVLRNINSLVRAKVNFITYWDITEGTVSSTIKKLFETIKDAEELELGPECFEILSESVVSGWQLPISKRKCLTVITYSEHELNISGIFALLKSSPKLERLDIQGFEPEGEIWDDAATDNLDCDLLHLKTVEIREFQDPTFDSTPMLTVARNLLKRATVLEEMTVRLNFRFLISEFIKTGQALLTFPRSSGKAVVRLDF